MTLINTNYTDCSKCLKCVRDCPSEAISIKQGKIVIDEKLCIHCHVCIQTCIGIKIVNAHMKDTFKDYDYKVALISGSFFFHTKSIEEGERLKAAFLKLGFDEVIDYGDVEGFVYKKHQEIAEMKHQLSISSFCPSVRRLIYSKYPMLVEQLIPIDDPVEISAKMVRERLKGQYQNIGIYSFCECVGKMALSKQPYQNKVSNIDHAMSISHVFPKITHLKNEDQLELNLTKDGIKHHVGSVSDANISVVKVDGLNKVEEVLELAEFDELKGIDLLNLYACSNGCIGGCFLWNNPFTAILKKQLLLDEAEERNLDINEGLYTRKYKSRKSTPVTKRLEKYKLINELLEELPGFDCGACGYPSCWKMAEDVFKGKAVLSQCRIRKEK